MLAALMARRPIIKKTVATDTTFDLNLRDFCQMRCAQNALSDETALNGIIFVLQTGARQEDVSKYLLHADHILLKLYLDCQYVRCLKQILYNYDLDLESATPQSNTAFPTASH